MLKLWLLIGIVLLLVSADSGFYIKQLLANAENAHRPQPLLWQGAIQGDEAASEQLTQLSQQQQNKYWLRKLIAIGYAPAALALSSFEDNTVRSRRLLKIAARGGVAQAQYQFSLLHDDADTRARWLEKAAQQGYFPAQTALADWYLLHQQPEKALPWLKITAPEDTQSAFQYGRLLWMEQSYDSAQHWLRVAAAQEHKLASRYVRVLDDYRPLAIDDIPAAPASAIADNACVQRIQFFATGLVQMEQATRFYQRFKNDTRLKSLPICMSKPLWLQDNALACAGNWQGSGRLGCDIAPLESVAKRHGFTHAVIFSSQGKANVNNGLMYLDVGDTYSVFVHELAHFAGFVDEYPINKELAQVYCERKTAPNLLFNGKITYTPLSNITQWQNFEMPVALYPSRTCNNIDKPSYKPSSRITFMQNHDTNVIPGLYRYIWKQQLLEPSAQRTIALNFFQYFQQQNNVQKAAYWLEQVRASRSTISLPETLPES